MKSLSSIRLVPIALFISFSLALQAQAASIAPEIGGSGTLNRNMTTDVTVNGLVSGVYRLYVFRGDDGFLPGSWNVVCNDGGNLYYAASANINNGQLGSASSGVSVLESGSNSIKLRFNIAFNQDHPNPPGASLVYALFALDAADQNSDLTVKFCPPDAKSYIVAYDVKGPFAVTNTGSGGGGGTTLVTIANTDEVAGKLGTAEVEGFSLGPLRNLFNTSGGTSLDTKFPVLGIILKSLLYLAGLLLLLSVVYAGIVLIRSTSDEEAAVAKKNLVWSLTGAFIIVIANWLVDTVIKFMQ